MIIVKVSNPSENFTIISRETLRDQEHLSAEALGVLCYLLSHRDGFRLNRKALEIRFDIGTQKMRRILDELRAAGYLTIQAAQAADGTFAGQNWTIFGESQISTESAANRESGDPSYGSTVARSTRPSLRRPESKKTKEEKKTQKIGDANAPGVTPQAEIREQILIFQETFNNLPAKTKRKGQTKSNWHMLEETVTDIEAWRRTMFAWKTNGWKAYNIDGMLERYHREATSGTQRNGAQTRRQSLNPGEQTDEEKVSVGSVPFRVRAEVASDAAAYQRLRNKFLNRYPDNLYEVQEYEQSNSFRF